MICYLDQTWCLHSKYECVNEACPFYLTDKEEARAEVWWGGKDFPVAWGDRKTDICGYKEGYNASKRSRIR